MYSTIENGKVLDWHFKKNELTPFRYVFYIGDIFIGQIFKVSNAWSAVSPYAGELNHCDGFKTRDRAAEFLLKVRRYHTQLEDKNPK